MMMIVNDNNYYNDDGDDYDKNNISWLALSCCWNW